MPAKTIVIILLAVAFGVGRFFVPTRSDPTPAMSYEAFAHLFVGGLFAAWYCTADSRLAWARGDRWLMFWLATAISGVELAVFLIRR